MDVLDDLATDARPLSRSERAPGAQTMTELDLHAARAFVATCRWTFAKTVPQHPHEYCLRDWVPDKADFDRFTALIASHGYSGRFWSQSWVYLHVDGFKYWQSQTLDRSGGLIVNRARLEPVDARPAIAMER